MSIYLIAMQQHAHHTTSPSSVDEILETRRALAIAENGWREALLMTKQLQTLLQTRSSISQNTSRTLNHSYINTSGSDYFHSKLNSSVESNNGKLGELAMETDGLRYDNARLIRQIADLEARYQSDICQIELECSNLASSVELVLSQYQAITSTLVVPDKSDEFEPVFDENTSENIFQGTLPRSTSIKVICKTIRNASSRLKSLKLEDIYSGTKIRIKSLEEALSTSMTLNNSLQSVNLLSHNTPNSNLLLSPKREASPKKSPKPKPLDLESFVNSSNAVNVPDIQASYNKDTSNEPSEGTLQQLLHLLQTVVPHITDKNKSLPENYLKAASDSASYSSNGSNSIESTEISSVRSALPTSPALSPRIPSNHISPKLNIPNNPVVISSSATSQSSSPAYTPRQAKSHSSPQLTNSSNQHVKSNSASQSSTPASTPRQPNDYLSPRIAHSISGMIPDTAVPQSSSSASLKRSLTHASPHNNTSHSIQSSAPTTQSNIPQSIGNTNQTLAIENHLQSHETRMPTTSVKNINIVIPSPSRLPSQSTQSPPFSPPLATITDHDKALQYYASLASPHPSSSQPSPRNVTKKTQKRRKELAYPITEDPPTWRNPPRLTLSQRSSSSFMNELGSMIMKASVKHGVAPSSIDPKPVTRIRSKASLKPRA